ncbi:DUF2924 domain-containing protein [Wolbachia endosymbiont of Drosophila tsacasi]|uniref:DUF2924 domain-containing protein n=1 Tax=Wolbachia endosymbiont of Drosophila tsacasi TaxID=3002579 RepID=UPI0023AA1499|nr:DUF2924 domain-containing protein [Wolbachia endosymbiont of Drosophila tsacasi]MDE5062072.1 DUF2924 domain-containing protein [Wolbachia endosymbiont of Drosophila tsacasi]
METSELTLLDLQNFFEKLKGHVRSEVEKYVDKKIEEIKDEAATHVINKMLNNMVGNEPIGELQIDKPKTDESKKVRIIKNKYSTIQNREVIKALFIGRTLIEIYKSKTYEVIVRNEVKFIYNGEIYSSLSAAGTRITGQSCDGWEFFKLRLNPEEGLRTLSYHRKKFFSDKNGS